MKLLIISVTNLDLQTFFQETIYLEQSMELMSKNLDDKKSKGTHWVSLFSDRNATVYFDSLGIEYIPQEVLNKIKDKWIAQNIFKM